MCLIWLFFTIDHPNGAAQDSSGNWIILANGLTSDSIQELAQEILSGMTISSPNDTPVLDIVVRARVIDGVKTRSTLIPHFKFRSPGMMAVAALIPCGPPSPVQPDGEIKTLKVKQDIDLMGC
ncbi:hypothetical protein OH492_10510 [Vibrio chagasii]|nr:hypothetical protein [Vibrio chagasii]